MNMQDLLAMVLLREIPVVSLILAVTSLMLWYLNSIYGGVPGNKITAIAGESSTGKTFFCLGIVQHFLDSNPDAGVIYFESESAISRQMIEDRGIASDRMMIVPVATIEEFRTQSCRILDKYLEQPKRRSQTYDVCS